MNNINNINNRVLVIYGPNMNLIGLRSNKEKSLLTLDKLSKHIKTQSKFLTIKKLFK